MKKLFITFILIISTLTFIGCPEKSLFTELSNNRLKVKIMGTFASNNPNNWISGIDGNSAEVKDNSIDDYDTSTDTDFPTQLKIDLAEMRLEPSSGKSQKFSNFRQTFTFDLTDTDSFFNGTGVFLKGEDVSPSKTFHYIRLYFRKMIFNNTKKYTLTNNIWSFFENSTELFKEKTIEGFDFNKLQPNSKWDSLRLESSSVNRVFPMRIPIINGFKLDYDNEETVLEVRLLFKNFIKKYEYEYYNNEILNVLHYFAPSDWLRDVKAGENNIGRNLLAVARVYIPEKVGTIEGTCTADRYIIAIPDDEFITDYTVQSHDERGTNVPNCDFPILPDVPGNTDINALMDYYLKFETYQIDFNNAVNSGCDTQDEYNAEWDSFENNVSEYKIPVLAMHTSSTTFKIENVMPGSYNIYESTLPLTYGKMFIESEMSQVNTTPVIVTTGTSAPANN